MTDILGARTIERFPMVSPGINTETTSMTGTSGNKSIDALLAPREPLQVPVSERDEVNGLTIAKWGGPIGWGAELSFSFFDEASTFASPYPSQYTDNIGEMSLPLEAAFRAALQSWATFADVSFAEITETSTSVGDIRIGVSLSNPNYPPDSLSAEAVPPAVQGLHAGDIFLAGGFESLQESGLKPGQLPYLTVLHELGHAVFNLGDVSASQGWNNETLPAGLNYRSQTIMSYAVLPSITEEDIFANQGDLSYFPTTPMILDILAAQWLYGSNMSTHLGDDTYVFTPSQTYHETVWDAGGIDTFDASATNAGVSIDLKPGTLSDVGSTITAATNSGTTALTETVGIAFGAFIENAIGGEGSDDLQGNELNNILWGGGGADVIGGGGGSDVLVATSQLAQHGTGDTASFDGRSDTFDIVGGIDYTVVTAADGSRDKLFGFQFLRFDDQLIELSAGSALAEAGRPEDFVIAERVALLYEAALNRDGAIDLPGLNFYIDVTQRDGLSDEFLAADLMTSPEFSANFGDATTLSNADFLEQIYLNVLDRTSDSAGRQFYLELLNEGVISKALALADIAISPENTVESTSVLMGLYETNTGDWGFLAP
ncbi:DUF4214 domain-containing protein [Sulfitobacter dubius]|uniref:DUF4214 domain-containing protein n=1 Tax=Sulfitobacter dubius TaxID=218673 RepID=UPI0022B02E69|nr:DUF4214 domain-containing protein [Sulfitobacter dubius]MCZ4368830.1 DUF4214 domain-containing protein [Sulfitobacter dubius]